MRNSNFKYFILSNCLVLKENTQKHKNILKKIDAEWRLKWIWDGNGDRAEGGDNSLTHS